MLDAGEIDETIEADDDDHPMEDDSDDGGDDGGDDGDDGNEMLDEIELQNDSKAYFDAHASSIFCIAAHPTQPIYLTGGGDDLAYIWTPNASDIDRSTVPRASKTIARLGGHTDSVSAAAFLGPNGEYAITGGLEGKLQLFSAATKWTLVDSVQEIDEVVWLAPSPTSKTTFAIGANDGSVWVYDVADGLLGIQQAFYSHTASCTAGAWAPSGELLCTVSEDGSFYAWEVASGRSVVGLTSTDQRFEVPGGLYSVAVSPNSSIAVVGGASGAMKVVGLPAASATKRSGQRPETHGGGPTGGGQAGQTLASLETHTESVESLSFHPTAPILASAGVDGKINLYDTAHNFALRRTLDNGHDEAVVSVKFLPSAAQLGWVLTSCGVDGTVRRWDARAGAAIGVWKGHLGGNGAEGEGGVLAFVQTADRVVTAGDDSVSLVFEMEGVAASGGAAAVAPPAVAQR